MFSLSIPCRPFPREGGANQKRAIRPHLGALVSKPILEQNQRADDFGHALRNAKSAAAINPVQVRASCELLKKLRPLP
jgi:hypothetical protein